jgi:signal peptidase I
LAVIFAPYIFWKIGSDPKSKYEGQILESEKKYFAEIQTAIESNNNVKLKRLRTNNPYQKGPIREWAEAIVFAVFAAAFIRMFLIEAYVIPTPSMEGSLLVGDFMFVSKAHYGIRTPMTIAMIPLLHNTIPYLNSESYLKTPSLGYHRLPAIAKINNNDPIVFNYPEGDSVYFTTNPNSRRQVWTAEDVRRNPEVAKYAKKRNLRLRPIDKRDHYIKRCIGIPGDVMEIKDRQVFINGKPLQNSKNVQFQYTVEGIQIESKGDQDKFLEKLEGIGVTTAPAVGDISPGTDRAGFKMHLSQSQKSEIQNWYPNAVITVVENKPNPIMAKARIFPHDARYYGDWTVDNFGPLTIPKKGATISLNKQTIALYRRIINVYEKNTLIENNGLFTINGQPATEYTFQQDYFWGMGDNRHASEDCRYFGFIPENHIVGRPLFIWFSTKNGNMKNGINWNRIFSGAYKM